MKIKQKTIYAIIFVILIGAGLMSALFGLKKIEFSFYNTKSVLASSNIEEYTIFIDAEESKLYLFQNGTLIKEYSCSGGKWNTPSPIGTWRITRKAKWGEGFRAEAFLDLTFRGENLEYMVH